MPMCDQSRKEEVKKNIIGSTTKNLTARLGDLGTWTDNK